MPEKNMLYAFYASTTERKTGSKCFNLIFLFEFSWLHFLITSSNFLSKSCSAACCDIFTATAAIVGFNLPLILLFIRAEVNYGPTHSTSKLEQHITYKHKAQKKRKLETAVTAERKNGFGLDSFLNYGGVSVDKYVDWIGMSCQPLDTCENHYFRAMVEALNPKAPLKNLSTETVINQVLPR